MIAFVHVKRSVSLATSTRHVALKPLTPNSKPSYDPKALDPEAKVSQKVAINPIHRRRHSARQVQGYLGLGVWWFKAQGCAGLTVLFGFTGFSFRVIAFCFLSVCRCCLKLANREIRVQALA